MKEQELYNALISVNIPETQAKQIAEDTMNEDKIADAMLYGIRHYGDKATTSIVEIRTAMVVNKCDEFQAVDILVNDRKK